MPPRSSLTGSFPLSDASNEVVCPLRNPDGSNCRKRCIGEKRYRSMQEHIRRAHPEYYISKLPATEESFQLMINTPPSERPQPSPSQLRDSSAYGHDRNAFLAAPSSPVPVRTHEETYPAAATAAVALAQLHNDRRDSDWESDGDPDSGATQKRVRSSFEIPPPKHHVQHKSIPPFQSPRPRELLPSIMTHSPPERSSTLPPIQRREKPARSRKPSVGQNARKAKHERTRSKDQGRRLSLENRKAFSAEPPAASALGKRWEDLVEAATSANEAESDRDLTPIPQSPASVKRASLPPLSSVTQHFNAYKASPLQRALTPPPPEETTEPFPSVESFESSQSGRNFHMPSSGLSNSDSSPTFLQPVQIYCAGCRRTSVLHDSYACTECISGFCSECVYALSSDQHRGRFCPRCQMPNPRYKQFQLDFR